MSVEPPLFKIPLQFRSKVSAGEVLRQAASCPAGCTGKGPDAAGVDVSCLCR